MVLGTALLLAAACRTGAARRAAERPATAGGARRDTLWLLAADPAHDAIHATTTEAELVQRYGADNVRRDRIALGEGETAPGTVVFPRDASRRLEILWGDTVGHARPSYVAIGGNPTRWLVAPGVTIGTPLTELERLNGGPFTLSGFDFDYAGTVQSWRGGRLDALWKHGNECTTPRVVVRLQPADDAPSRLTAQVSGERAFPSTHPAMQRLDPRVYALFVCPR